MPATTLSRLRIVRRFRLRNVEFPIANAPNPKRLDGCTNGRIPPAMLDTWTDHRGRTCRMMAEFRRPWVALVWLAHLHTGRRLTFTSSADVYRDFGHQERAWLRRMTRTTLPGRPSRMCGYPDGVARRWWLKPLMAGIACPGTSNHGWGGKAIDHTTDRGRTVTWLRWLAVWAPRLGWSWEAPSEDWHIRYCLADDVTGAALAVEAAQARPVVQRGSTGPDVRAVQATVGATVDGQFGPRTQAAVIAWQTRQRRTYAGVRTDGVWDAGCWWIASNA